MSMSVSKGRKIPDGKRDLFKRPLGIDLPEERLHELDEERMLITVGDVVSLTVREHGIVPDLSVYDGMTERREMTGFAALVRDRGLEEIVVSNEAGTVSVELATAIGRAVKDGPGIIRVIGEEDLATLPCILLAPEGSYVIYGWPGLGMKLVVIDGGIRREIELLMEEMEELE